MPGGDVARNRSASRHSTALRSRPLLTTDQGYVLAALFKVLASDTPPRLPHQAWALPQRRGEESEVLGSRR